MNRVKFVLKNLFYRSNILRETRKINKEKYNKKINNHTKIVKREYHTANPKPNNNANNDPNKNNIKIFIIAIMLGQFYYMRKTY